MNAEPIAVLKTLEDAIVPLKKVSATGRLEGLLFELSVEQHYQNTTEATLETVFTFPLPLRAVLLGFELELNGTRHVATAVARQQAEERYEQAIDSGDSAALLTDNGNGLYTVNLGNLQAGDTAVIRYRYAELLSAHDDYVRLTIPTAIAPRYGDPASAGLEGPSIPGSNLFAEYPFDLKLDLIGLKDPNAVRSRSHALRIQPTETGLAVQLARQGYLDRDVALDLQHASLPHEVLLAQDGDGTVALLSAALPRDESEQRPLTLKLLLDCSGSMQGSSIAAAKRALSGLLDRLDERDVLSLTRFGSRVKHISKGLELVDEHSLRPLKELVRQIEADLGGTEMAKALRTSIRIPSTRDGPIDVILITDGEIHDLQSVLDVAAEAHHRLFVIAIGAAPNEALARSLAEHTGGACEFVANPGDAEDAILRMFHRLRSTPRTLQAIDWTATPAWITPHPAAIFPGDTLHRFAGFAARLEGPVALNITDAEGMQHALVLPVAQRLTAGDALPRLAAARRLSSLSEADATALAVQYQLASTHTSFVLVAERAIKANELPATIAVPHMLAAGWGGNGLLPTGTPSLREGASEVRFCLAMPDTPTDINRRIQRSPRPVDAGDDLYVAREVLRSPRVAPEASPEVQDMLNALTSAHAAGQALPTTLAELCAIAPVPPRIKDYLEYLIAMSRDMQESEIVRVFLALLANRAPSTANAAFLKAVKGRFLSNFRYRTLRRRITQEVLA